MKKYLITGCAGFIGSNFVYYMLEKYKDILLVNLDKLTYAGNLENLKGIENDSRHIFVQGDICDKELVSSLMNQYDFDYVINFAAESHVDRSIANPEIFVQTNVMGTVNLLQRAKEAWYDAKTKTWKEGKKYLQVSTDEVYGALGADGYFMETTPINPHSPYSSSKASADHFVKAFYDTYGMPVNITRCSNNYGPYQFPEKLIPLMINNVKQHKQLPVYGDGMQIRDWLYVEDHCKAIDMVCNGGKIGEVYNVGGHNERPNIFIVKTIIEQLYDRLQDDGISEASITYIYQRLCGYLKSTQRFYIAFHLEDHPEEESPVDPPDEAMMSFGEPKSYLTFDDVRILTGLSKKELKKKLKEKQIVAMYDEDAVRQAFDEDIC